MTPHPPTPDTEQAPAAPSPAERSPAEQPSGESTGLRSRDADQTRRLLLQAARRRFARDGYTTTTVRDIAADAGVNVALINRYFISKEGLFEACLSTVAEEFGRSVSQGSTVDQILNKVIGPASGSSNGDQSLMLLLLLRSSGDDRADGIRRNTLRSFAERMAEASDSHPDDADDADDDRFLLRAQIALATTLGIVILRSSTGLEPLTSATEDELRVPFGDVLSTLLSPSRSERP
ncbi:TetR/AcrR family transcriptional regulator [Compostimonas suwonensis]|uniref:AcrR family transcriptional regulator n=1 Tax=Compostimonas suwonensis TaxID=1048394 RepID=A0A2M9BWX7_9MICO|nr:TetR family transcriptional regulator [Compostimonas suwonensis]PJJ62430.1 AcrR family transcriptional regulator [Compostimonas suwonensis]